MPAPATRATEATAEQVIATGAMLGTWAARDPIDGDTGYRLLGSGGARTGRETPYWTREKARIYAVASYKSNPMARAVVDTYTSFAVGDSGVKFECSDPEVHQIVEEFWTDPRNRIADIQELWLRSLMLLGEDCTEMLVGETSGVVRFSPIDPAYIGNILCEKSNPLWPAEVRLLPMVAGAEEKWPVVAVDETTGLRTGRAMWWAPWRTLMTDVRGESFLMPILDDIDAYDSVISNLIDRTALARHLVWDVKVTGGQDAVNNYVKERGGLHMPPSGSVEVHNDAVEWKPMTASTGADEDSVAASTVLTKLAAGAGLTKTWLAEPDGANRATSLTMAEPVRRRVAGVQKIWLACQTELTRFAVDRAVAAKRLPEKVTARDPKTKQEYEIPAAMAVTVTGPEVAAADAQVTAQILLNLSTGLKQMTESGVLSKEAASVAAKKAWEQFVGVPYSPSLDNPNANPDDVATHVDDNAKDQSGGLLRLVTG